MFFLALSTLSFNERDFTDKLFRKYYPFIKHTIFELTNNSNVVPDLANDALVKLMKNISTIMNLNQKQITQYVYQTARTTAINFIAKDHKLRETQVYGNSEDISCWVPDNTGVSLEEGTEIKLEYNETMSRVKQLPEKDRNLFLLRYLYGMSDKQIAKQLDMNPEYVRVYLSRVRKKLFVKEAVPDERSCKKP